MRDCLLRGEAPFASHGLYTQPGVLRDEVPAERDQGIGAGFSFRRVVAKTVFYVNLGWSRGMQYGKADAEAVQAHHETSHHTIEVRELPCDWEYLAREEESRGVAAHQWFLAE